ncbi:MAG: hypothetical protein J6R17_02740 [Bacteroidales bacterium]|nr:hypothetical protein [Bacteroidales bacterium]
MSVDDLVKLWNDGIENHELTAEDLYSIIDAFLAKKVKTIEMQRSGAIVKRLQISYDVRNNIIVPDDISLMLCRVCSSFDNFIFST